MTTIISLNTRSPLNLTSVQNHDPLVFRLTYEELNYAGKVGFDQNHNCKANGVRDKHGADFDYYESMTSSVAAAIAELAVAKAFNLAWTRMTKIGAPDVGGFIEVRTVKVPSFCLLLHEDDDPTQDAVLAYVDPKNETDISLLGWINIKDGQRPEYWKDLTKGAKPGRDCFVVPREIMHPMSTFQDRVNKRLGLKHA